MSSQAAPTTPAVPPVAPPKQDVAPVVTPTATTPDVAQQLNELELKLSRMVAEPPATWNTEALQQSAHLLLAKANSPADQDAIKSTSAKIDRFAVIQQRSVAANAAGATRTVASSISPTTITPLPNTGLANSAVTSGSTASQYDAIGILRPVVSKRPGAPQFALVDDRGQVVTFVTATPDINLQPYLGQRLGVVGSRGYIPEFHRAHVTASRIAPLGNTVLR
jgi:hypothetical protein